VALGQPKAERSRYPIHLYNIDDDTAGKKPKAGNLWYNTAMNKKAFKVTNLKGGNDRQYWKNKSYAERLEALEQLRQIVFGYDPTTARLQRTLKITKLKED